MHDTDDLQLRHATGVFNLVCTLHAAADKLEAERDRGLCDWLATTWERFNLLLGRRSPLREYTREQKYGRQASLKIRLPVPKSRWHVLVTLCYSHDFQQLVAMYARNSSGQWRRMHHTFRQAPQN